MEKDTRDLIVQKLKDDERTIPWLGKKAGIPYGTLYDCVVRKGFHLSPTNLDKINSVLGTNFTIDPNRRGSKKI